MDLGLGNLDTLKRALLPDAQREETQFDALLAQVGSGVAAAFEKLCNRQWARVTGATFECDACRLFAVLPRAPLEALTALEQRDTLAEGWYALTLNDVVMNLYAGAGMVDFGAPLGDRSSRLRITYTGGYWYSALEPGEDGAPETMPDGATALPADLRHAWLLQCQHVAEQCDVLSARLAGAKKLEPSTIELLPTVREILRGYIRYV